MERVVITGIGVVAPGGIGKDAFWETMSTGKSTANLIQIDERERFRSQVVAAIMNWDPCSSGLTEEEVARTSRHTQFGLVAALEACRESNLQFADLDPTRIGVAAGTAIGSTLRLEQ